MTKLDIDEFEFLSYGLHVQQAKGYQKRWLSMIYKANYGKWLSNSKLIAVSPKEPSEQFTTWLQRKEKDHVAEVIERKQEINERKQALVADITKSILERMNNQK